MTIEGLEILAANLYKEAEEATPIIGGADKKDWQARKIEELVENDAPELEELLNCETIDEVLNYLDGWYDRRDLDTTEDIHALEPDDEYIRSKYMSEMDELNSSKMDEPVDETKIVSPVADVLGITDTMSGKTMEQEVVHDQTVEEAEEEAYGCGCRSSHADEMDTEHNRLVDEFVDERPEQPEYLDDEPNRFDPDLIIEEEYVLINDGVDDRMREAVDSKDENLTCRGN